MTRFEVGDLVKLKQRTRFTRYADGKAFCFPRGDVVDISRRGDLVFYTVQTLDGASFAIVRECEIELVDPKTLGDTLTALGGCSK